LDETGAPRVRYDVANNAGDIAIMTRLAGQDSWQEVYRYNQRDAEQKGIQFAGFTKDPNIAYVVTRNGGDRAIAYEFDLRTKSLGKVVYQNPQFDVAGYEREPYTGRVIGVEYADMDGGHVQWFDQSWAQVYADVNATFPGSIIDITSSSVDRKKMIV